MKSALFILAISLVAALSGCGVKRDAEVKSFIAEVDQVAIDIVRAVDEKPAVAGVETAQQMLERRKPQLKAKFETLKDLRGYQVSEETTKKFSEAVSKNVGAVMELQVKYAEQASEDEKFSEKLNKLSDDFNAIFGV